MSEILIRDIEIPKKGNVGILIYADGSVEVCGKGALSKPTYGTPTTKAIEVPTHGRLVDAEEVKKLLQSGLSLDTYEDQAYVCSLIDEIPTIIDASTATGFCNTEGCSNSKPDMSKAQNHICPYYQGVCSLDEKMICYCQYHYEMCDKFIEVSKEKE